MMGSQRTLAGNVGIGVFIVAFVCTVIGSFSSSWLISDERIKSAKFDRLGLWTHCFRSFPDPLDPYQRRFYVGCRWVFDPFTYGYDQLKGFLMPPFIVVTQVFYTVALIGVLASFILVLLFFLCLNPGHKYFIKVIAAIAVAMLIAGVCSAIAVIVFAIWANKEDWQVGHDNNYFGWAFVTAIVGCIASFIAGGAFFVETIIQRKKHNHVKQGRIQMEGTREL